MELSYPIPWKLLFDLWPHMLHRTPTSVDAFSASIVARMQPAPIITGQENLPPSPRFVLAANHYQRPGLWIMHPASVLTQAIRQHYGPARSSRPLAGHRQLAAHQTRPAAFPLPRRHPSSPRRRRPCLLSRLVCSAAIRATPPAASDASCAKPRISTARSAFFQKASPAPRAT